LDLDIRREPQHLVVMVEDAREAVVIEAREGLGTGEATESKPAKRAIENSPARSAGNRSRRSHPIEAREAGG
jgi:hypothetical protein